jgi:hypothetical protein
MQNIQEFITERAIDGNVSLKTEFIVTGCYEANRIFSVAHPRGEYALGHARYNR